MENICFNIYDVLSLFGGFLALLLGFILVFHEKFRTKSNLALGIILFSLFLTITRNIIGNMDKFDETSIIYYLPISYIFLMPLGFYYNILFLLNPNYQFKKKDYWLILPIFLTIFIDAIFLFLYFFKPEILEPNLSVRTFYGDTLMNSVFVIYFLFLLPIIRKKLDTYQKQLLNNFSNIEDKNLEWLKRDTLIILGIIVVFIALKIFEIFFPYAIAPWFYLLWILCTAYICLIGFKFILNQNFYLVPHFRDKNDSTISQKPLSEKTDEHYQHLLNLMTQEKLYQDADLNMDTLSAKIKLSKSYVSRIINQKEGKNFYDFVNNFRVEEVKSNLNNPDFSHYSILGIGLAAGFKSKSTFNTVFKKMTGKTPSVYKKTTM